jgi:hypothetical protein
LSGLAAEAHQPSALTVLSKDEIHHSSHIFSISDFKHLHSSYEQKGDRQAEGVPLVDGSLCYLFDCIYRTNDSRLGFHGGCSSGNCLGGLPIVEVYEILRLVRSDDSNQFAFYR